MTINDMTLKEKIGQLFMVGFEDEGHLDYILNEYSFGGFIYFKRNVKEAENAKYLSSQIMQNCDIYPFISIDQEGGIVNRISKGLTHVPGQMATAATENPISAYKVADILSKELGALGINMPLGPVLDVNNNPFNPVINVRSFGENPDLVSRYGAEALKAYMDNNMIAVGKHFPGHGDTDMDSHLSLPIIRHNKDRIEKVELKPFKDLIEKGLPAIMVSHVVFPSISQNVPATLSKEICQGLLREELGFEGLIMTDCMEMDAIDKHFDIAEASVMSLKAGVDMILISHSLEKQIRSFERVYQAVLSEEIPMALIDEKLLRILKVKEHMHAIEYQFDSEEHIEISKELFLSSVTAIEDQLIPLSASDRVLWLLPETESVELFLREKEEINYSYHRVFERYDTEDYDYIVLCTNKRDRLQNDLIESLDKDNTIHVSLLSPYDLNTEYRTRICLYEGSHMALDALYDVLYGEYTARGRLPVTLSGRE